MSVFQSICLSVISKAKPLRPQIAVCMEGFSTEVYFYTYILLVNNLARKRNLLFFNFKVDETFQILALSKLVHF